MITKEMKAKPIIVIDSGLGGLMVVKKLKRKYGEEKIHLIYDNEFMPYGTKDPKQLLRRSMRLIKKIKLLDPKLVIIACNTIDAVAGEQLEITLPKVPFVRVIAPTARKAIENSKSKKLAVLGTTNTIESQKYLLSIIGMFANTQVYGVDCPNLATAIEKDENISMVMKEELSVLDNQDFDTMILGCTHYSAIATKIKKKFPEVELIDSVKMILEEVRKYSESIEQSQEKVGDKVINYFISESAENKHILEEKPDSEKVKIKVEITQEDQELETKIETKLKNVEISLMSL